MKQETSSIPKDQTEDDGPVLRLPYGGGSGEPKTVQPKPNVKKISSPDLASDSVSNVYQPNSVDSSSKKLKIDIVSSDIDELNLSDEEIQQILEED